MLFDMLTAQTNMLTVCSTNDSMWCKSYLVLIIFFSFEGYKVLTSVSVGTGCGLNTYQVYT